MLVPSFVPLSLRFELPLVRSSVRLVLRGPFLPAICPIEMDTLAACLLVRWIVDGIRLMTEASWCQTVWFN